MVFIFSHETYQIGTPVPAHMTRIGFRFYVLVGRSIPSSWLGRDVMRARLGHASNSHKISYSSFYLWK
jgi:hypothetical protein